MPMYSVHSDHVIIMIMLQLYNYHVTIMIIIMIAVWFQHTITAMALPTSLVLPQEDLETGSHVDNNNQQMQNLLQVLTESNRDIID